MGEYQSDTNEKGCRWHFAPQEGGREDGPNDAMMQNFKASPYKALVREAVQNSLDAVLDSTKPVRVEFTFANLNARSFNNFFALQEHILECKEYFGWQGKAVELYGTMASYFSTNLVGKGIGYIKVSDYNTKGMRYDPNSSSSPFYAFARAAGVSSKIDQESGGSFGFGKSAYFQLSPISTIFISTLTDRGQNVFEGVSWLCSHKYKGTKVSSVGYYDNNEGKPIDDVERIPARFQRKESGTNFYIMGFRDSDKAEAQEDMITEALRSFWYAIYCGKLEITVSDQTVNADNLESYLTRYFADDIDDTAKRGYYNPRPYFNAVNRSGTDSNVRCFTEKLPILGECSLFLIKAKCPKDKLIYMRRPLMLVYGKRTQTSYGVFGLFVCTNPKGDEILRSLENPAHDEWKASNWRNANGRIEDKGTQALEEIHQFRQRCFMELFSNSQETALEITGLDELLYVPEDLLADGSDDYDHQIGNPTGNIKEDGLSMTSDIKDNPNIAEDDDNSSNIGSVKITLPGSSDEYDDPEEDTDSSEVIGIGGHSKKKSKRKGGKATAGNTPKIKSIDDISGTYKMYLSVEFRAVAQNENGKFYHYLKIHSPHDVIDGELELITIGEQSDDIVNLDYTDNGEIVGNIIKGVVLEEGRNSVKVHFDDNMRHAIKLKAYENK